jgi:alkanesulfonate monooxygenase SsuD/methylene tetrahydromethanopterin reductase-like flavin-dependent oxidoreductase (luciferase family)
MWHQMGAYSAWHAEDDGRASDAVPPLAEALVRERAMLGTPAEVSEQARPWIEEFGHRELHVLLRLHYPGLRREAAEAALRLFAAEVIPRLKQHQRNDMAEEVSAHE